MPRDVLQQFTRNRASDGSEVVSGRVRVALAVGQRTASVHIAFCPAFSQIPQIAVEQCEGEAARIKVGQLLPYGARFDLKLGSPSRSAEGIVLRFWAEAPAASAETDSCSEELRGATRIAVAVVQQGGRVLIGQRPPGVPLAGLWEFPGGKILSGETPEQAAVRECQEEAGVMVRIGDAYPDTEYQYPHGRVHLHFFAADPLDPKQLPREPFRWVALHELASYQFPAANQALVESLMKR